MSNVPFGFPLKPPNIGYPQKDTQVIVRFPPSLKTRVFVCAIESHGRLGCSRQGWVLWRASTAKDQNALKNQNAGDITIQKMLASRDRGRQIGRGKLPFPCADLPLAAMASLGSRRQRERESSTKWQPGWLSSNISKHVEGGTK